ncbi:hypothetical protein EJ04DRAFT_287432 [Polyplosphaeria fusca]|uniref:Uncharacterized protein n=1 Tax=Polyplosphaeria fusca TaxID=682080 RepID=A0A9P4V8N7_9PLEO|nr:hypothetical protein EJ04DRAFT_287432 [Polyplosphaeria fusca]
MSTRKEIKQCSTTTHTHTHVIQQAHVTRQETLRSSPYHSLDHSGTMLNMQHPMHILDPSSSSSDAYLASYANSLLMFPSRFIACPTPNPKEKRRKGEREREREIVWYRIDRSTAASLGRASARVRVNYGLRRGTGKTKGGRRRRIEYIGRRRRRSQRKRESFLRRRERGATLHLFLV